MVCVRVRAAALTALLVAASTAGGQAPAAPAPTPVRELQLSATSLLSGGNLARIVVQGRLAASAAVGEWQGVTENAYRYGRNGSRVVEDDVLSRNYLRFRPGGAWYGYLLAVVEVNHRRSIERRSQLGAGAAWNLATGDDGDFLRAGLAVVHEATRFQVASFNLPAYDGNATVEEPRALLRFGGRHAVLERRLVLGHDSWYMAGLRRGDAPRAHSLLSLQVPVAEGVSVRGEYDYTYERLTISGVNPLGNPASRDDWVLSFGLGFELGRRAPGAR